ncbi:MAG: EamA family transporter, partial [Pseudomonadota bacterium]
MSDNARGILFMVMFTLIIPIGDALMKILAQEFHPSQALSARFVIMIIMIAPAGLMLPRETLIAPPGRGMLLVRGFLMAGASVMYVAALETVPLATLAAIVLLAPLIVTAVSPFVLGERVGWIRYSAIL